MAKQLIKGNDAVVKGAILAGCRFFFGYPITPASEIAHAAAKWFPSVGREFLQAECETASINMVYGAAAAGTLAGPRIVSIGPITSDALRELGTAPDVEAAVHTPDGLLDALLADAAARR